MRNKYWKALKETFDISNRNDLRQYHIEPLSRLIRTAPKALALCVGGYLAFQGKVTLGILVAFIGGIEKINDSLVNAYQLVVRTQLAAIAVGRVFEIMDMPEEEDFTEADSMQMENARRKAEPVFFLRNVSFTYAGQAEKVRSLNCCAGSMKSVPVKFYFMEICFRI